MLILLLAAWIFIETPFGQNWLGRQVTQRLSKNLKTRVEVRHISFSLFNKMHLEGLLIEDQQGDTLVYAGDLNFRITDWFFLRDGIEIKYLGLEDAQINLRRQDSTWNHQFILDRLQDTSNTASTGAQNPIRLKIQELDFSHVRFRKLDAWVGEDLDVRLGKLSLDAREIDLAQKRVLIKSLLLADPVVAIRDYPKRRPDRPKIEKADIADSSIHWNRGGWLVQLERLDIQNGLFRADRNDTISHLSYFDGAHVVFGQINGQLSNLQWAKDSITTQVKLATRERSGFEVKQLDAKMTMTPYEMAFRDLAITTNNSSIHNFFRMSFADFDKLGDFVHQVNLQAGFEESEIDTDDIAYFAPELGSWKKKLLLRGNVRGTVDDLFGRDVLLQAGKNTILNGDISLTGLPAIERTFIDFKANDFRTNYEDAVTFVPALRKVKAVDLARLRYLRFTGSFTGFVRDFVTYGTLRTDLGTITSDLNMKLPAGQEPIYSGKIATDYFRLGEFLNDPDIGAIAMNDSLAGSGFSEKTRNARINSRIQFVEYKGYRYHDLDVRGRLNKKLFDGFAAASDPQVNFAMKGLVDFNNDVPVFNFIADVKKANLRKLNLTREDISFSGKLNLDFTGSNIDNFLGKANIQDATLTHRGNPLPFDSLMISSVYANGVKRLTVQSNEFEGNVTGNFAIRDLPNAFTLFLNKYYPAYIRPPRRIPENESFTFDITTYQVDDYLRLFDSTLGGFNNSHVDGRIHTENNELAFNAEVPQFRYRDYVFDDVKLNARGNRHDLALSGSASNIQLRDSLNIPLAVFDIQARNDSSRVRIRTGATQAINQTNLNGEVLTYGNGVKIRFASSSFVLNGKTWTIDEKGELELRDNMPASGEVVLRESNQEIRMRTQLSETGNWNDIAVDLKKVNIGDFSPILLPHNRLEGILSGNVLVEDPTNHLYVTTDNLVTEGLRLDNDSLGDVSATASYNHLTRELKVKSATNNAEHNLTADADIFLQPDKAAANRINLKAKSFELKFLHRFLGDLFSDITGYVTGDFDLAGPLEDLHITGKGRLRDAGLKVLYTQCFYKIRDTDLSLTPELINLDGIVLTDPVTGNPIYLQGGIQHNAFRNMFYDLRVTTRKPGTIAPADNKAVQLLNTSFADNKEFYGRVKGTGSFSLSGPENEMYMQIDAIASTLSTDSSQITIPPTESRESGIADFLVERKYGREMEVVKLIRGGTNITYDVNVTANPNLLVRVVLDELTGDEIKGRGTGTLNIHSGTNEPLTMRGRFDIQEGDYLFTFQSFFKKPFKLRKGGDNYISWDRDPYGGKINVEAVYTAEKVSFAPLATAKYVDQSYARQRENVDVVAKLTGELFKPNFQFHLEFPPNSITKSDFSVAANIQQIENNPNEINRQVTYLIVFNSFAPAENTAGTGQGLGSTVSEFTNNTISSLSGLFFNEINKKLNSELAKILKSDNITVNFSGYVYNRNFLTNQTNNGIGFNQGAFNVNVPISLFKDRFVVTLGSSLDVPLQSTIQQNVQFLPDVTAEWLINQSGTVRASFFYRQDLDYLTTSSTGAARNKRSGASIAYRREFDTPGEFLTEFFGKKKKRRPLPPPPPDTIRTEAPVLPGGQD